MKKNALLLMCILLLLTDARALAGVSKRPGLDSLAVSPLDTRVDLNTVKVDDIDKLTLFLDSYPNLRRVDMYETVLKAGDADMLSARYPRVSFGWTLRLVEKHTIRTDATAFAINHNNRSDTHKSEDFRALKYCRSLRALDLGHNAITDLGFLKGLTELRVIILACNLITDISPLKELKNLEYAELFNNYIADYSPLGGLDKLIDLNLCFNQSEDFGPLYSLKNLQRLWLYNANNRVNSDPVDPQAVAALSAALPGCLIDTAHYSTLGGWRTHERYYVVFNMFHGVVSWLPWSAEGLVPRYN